MERLFSVIEVNVGDWSKTGLRPMLVVANDLPLECTICVDCETKLFAFVDCERDAQSRDGVMYHDTFAGALAALIKDAAANDAAIAAYDAEKRH